MQLLSGEWHFINEKSTLVQVMAWCHQATSRWLSQCWPRTISPYAIARPQRVKRNPTWLWYILCMHFILSILQIIFCIFSAHILSKNLNQMHKPSRQCYAWMSYKVLSSWITIALSNLEAMHSATFIKIHVLYIFITRNTHDTYSQEASATLHSHRKFLMMKSISF